MSTVTARIPEETSDKLKALAKATNRSKSYLVAMALERFLEEQTWQMTQTLKSIAEADAGIFATEEEVRQAFAKWGVDIDEVDENPLD